MKIRYPKFGSNTSITLGPSQVTYRTRVPQGDRLVKVFLNDPTNPRVQSWTESYHEGLTVSPLSLPLHDVIRIVFDALRRLGKEVPATLFYFDLSKVLPEGMSPPIPISGTGQGLVSGPSPKDDSNADSSSQDPSQVQDHQGRQA